MAVDRIWVLAEFAESGPTSLTEELLTEARAIGTNVSAVTWGPDTAAHAGALGDYGATKVYDVGDIGGALPGAPVAGAIAALIEGGDRPDALLIPASYDGRDVAGRLSVKLDRPVLTNVVGLSESGGLSSQHTLFGGHHRRDRPTSPGKARTSSWSGPSPSPPRPAAGDRPRWSPPRHPTLVRPARPRSPRVTSRSAAAPSSTRQA